NVSQLLDLFMADLEESGFHRAGLDNAFRAVHSLKSEAAFLDFHSIHDTAHDFESLLQQLRDRNLPEGSGLDEELLQVISDAVRTLVDVTQAKLDDLGVAGDEPGSEWKKGTTDSGIRSASLSVYDSAFGDLSESEAEVMHEAIRRGDVPYLVQCRIAETERLELPRLFLLINNLETVCTVIRTVPDFDSLEEQRYGVFKALVVAGCEEDALYDALNVDQVSSIELQSLNSDQVSSLRHHTRRSNSTVLSNDRNSVTLDLSARRYATMSLYSDELFFQLREAIQLAGHGAGTSSHLRQALRAAETLASRVNETLLDTSLISLNSVIEPVHQMVAELCSAAGKNARLFVSGDSERVFLPVADVISDILLHLVRNSVDHGIEDPAERARAGKDIEGRIEVLIRRAGGALEIRFRDDGRGIDEDMVREALARTPAAEAPHGFELEVEEHDGEEDVERAGVSIDLFNQIARPGFTTAREPGPVSGRGVGLDAVRHAVETLLSGTLSMHNNPGHGVEFVMLLPASTRLLTVLVFESGEKPIAIPASQVSDTFPIDVSRIGTDTNGEYFYRMSDGVVRLFVVGGASIPDAQSSSEHAYGILLQVADRKGIVLADRLVSEEVVVRHDSDRRRVYSKTLDRNVDLFIPVKI
ncbi:MAG: ATP-binding protein, partial [Spirochaetota bacterium]